MAVRTCLAPVASEQGTVLSLGGHETNQSTVPVLSTVLCQVTGAKKADTSAALWSSQSGGRDGCCMCLTMRRGEGRMGQCWEPWVNRSGAHPVQGLGKPS